MHTAQLQEFRPIHPGMVAIVFEFSRVYFRAVLARLRALQSSLGALVTTLPW